MGPVLEILQHYVTFSPLDFVILYFIFKLDRRLFRIEVTVPSRHHGVTQNGGDE